MTKQIKMTCIVCPIGCELCVAKSVEGLRVTGNKCPRGITYAEQEITDPRRTVTSTVRIDGWLYPVIPVKTDKEIPKDKIFDIIDLLSDVVIQAPVSVGDVVVKNILDLGANVVVTNSTT